MKMEMDVYDYESYLESLSNLLLLKLFYEEGVDVTMFGAFMTHVNYASNESDSILLDGLQAMFEVVEFKDSEEMDKNESLKVLSKDDSFYETTLVVEDTIFTEVLNGPYLKDFNEMVESSKTESMESKFYVLANGNGIVVTFEYFSRTHELLEEILAIRRFSINLLEREEKSNEHKNQHGHRIVA